MKETKVELALVDLKTNKFIQMVAQQANDLGLANEKLSEVKIKTEFLGNISVTFLTTSFIHIK